MFKTFGLASFFFAAMAGVAPAQEGASSPQAAPKATLATGTVKIHIALKASTSLPNGTTLSINCGASLFDPTLDTASSSYVYPSAQVTAGKANVTVSIPYKWIVSDSKNTVYVAVAVSASGSGGVYDTSSFTASFALPANGTETTVRFSGTI